MKKQLICVALVCLLVLCPLGVSALDPGGEVSLTLQYESFGDLPVRIYRVAEALENGTFELVEPFSSYPVNIHDITRQEQWQEALMTLSAYIAAHQPAPYREKTTDETGTVVFDTLETGLYLVCQVTADNPEGTWVFNGFLVYLPTPQPDGTCNYRVEAKPKCVSYVPKTEYRVTKLWKDTGFQSDRPEQVTVDIYKDGVLQESQVLSPENNWSYHWYVSQEDRGQWLVTERQVSDQYTVSIQQNGAVFFIVNTHKSLPQTPTPPYTGDTENPLIYILILSGSGIALVLLAIYGRRRKDK